MKDNHEMPLPALACTTIGDQELVALARSRGLSEEAAKAVAAIDGVMARIRRNIMRREFGRVVLAQIAPDLEVAHMDVISAIAHRAEGDAEEVTVGLIAERLGIDPSRASRVSADVVDRGFARRVASQQDARRICLELTPKGKRFVDAIRQSKMATFASALGQWEESELIVFANLLDRFSTWATDPKGLTERAAEVKALLNEPEAQPAPKRQPTKVS
jgi:DNA-binding MarR family transcriptional regulator